MNLLKIAFSALVLMFYFPLVFAQSATPEGNWVTIDDKTGEKRAVIQFVIKEGKMSGTVVDVYPQPGDTGICSACPGAFKDKPIKGMQIAWGLRDKGDGATWDGGQILDAKTGKIYHFKITMKDNKLYVRGYIGFSLLGRTQVWERV